LAAAGAVGAGADVAGTAVVEVMDTSSLSSAIITATGKPTVVPKPSTPKPSLPKPPTTVVSKPVVVTTNKVYPSPDPKVYVKKMESVKPQPKCGDIKDDMCPAIGSFKNCGYCIL